MARPDEFDSTGWRNITPRYVDAEVCVEEDRGRTDEGRWRWCDVRFCSWRDSVGRRWEIVATLMPSVAGVNE